jgi:hypothetical protein
MLAKLMQSCARYFIANNAKMCVLAFKQILLIDINIGD